MSINVYANGNAIAGKSGDSKVIAAMPDVCLSPPSPPAGPVPVPYPNTSMSKDTQEGSKTVQIADGEVMLKDQSFYKTSPLGDEAATNGLGAGIISHVITGKTYFVAWSMDVKFEGENVDRHIDMTTSNHASTPGTRSVPAPSTEDQSKACPHANLKRDPPKGESRDAPGPPGSASRAEAKRLRKRRDRFLNLAVKAEQQGKTALMNALLNHGEGLEVNAQGADWEGEVAEKTNAKETSIKVTCADCGKLLEEYDVLTEDGVLKECKTKGNAVDEQQLIDQQALAVRPDLFGAGAVCHWAIPQGERKNVRRLQQKDKTAGKFQEH